MAAATGRFVSFCVVRVDLGGSPLALAGRPPVYEAPRPRRIDPASVRAHQEEDWSDIEALLTAGIAVHEGEPARSRHRALPLLISSALGTALFAGLVATYLTTGCGAAGGCATRTAAKAPVVPERQAASSAAPPLRVAARPDPDVAQPVVQGRSVGEDDGPKAEAPAVDDMPSAPRRHRRHHRHRWW